MPVFQFNISFTSEMKFLLNNKHFSLGTITNHYADVMLHVEEQKNLPHSIIKANKVLLAYHSPYFHRMFQSCETTQTFHMGFMGVSNYNVRDAVSMIYGESVHILEKNVNRFSAFLKLLEIDYETSDIDEGEGERLAKRLKQVTREEIANDSKRVVTASLPEKNKSVASPTLPSRSIPTTAVPTTLSCSPTERALPKDAAIPASSTFVERETTSSSFIYTNRRGEPCFSDNWTETSETNLVENLKAIDFNIDAGDTGGHHKNYICIHCGILVNAFDNAKHHFTQNHQTSDAEINVIKEVTEYKKTAFMEIHKLQLDIQDGCNKAMTIFRLNTIIVNLRERINTLENLDKKNLTRILVWKKSELVKAISETVIEVEGFIRMLEEQS